MATIRIPVCVLATTLSASIASGCGSSADPTNLAASDWRTHHHPDGGTALHDAGAPTTTASSSSQAASASGATCSTGAVATSSASNAAASSTAGAGGAASTSAASATSAGAGGAHAGSGGAAASSGSSGSGGHVDAGPSSGLALHVVDNHLVDANGQAVRLLGVDRSGSEFKCIQGGSAGSLGWGIFDGPIDLPSAQAIAAWHANAVRVPLNEDCWLGINGVNPAYGGAAYQSAIAGYVATLHRAGLYVVLDLHWNAPAGLPAASQQPLPDADHAPAFWSSVAATFGADAAVVLDLYNEPFLYGSYLQNAAQDPWDCWLNGCGLNQYLTGGTPYTASLNWQSAGMQSLVSAVRATGATNVIMVGGLDWANDLSGWLAHAPSDPLHNVAASWHSYPGEGCDLATCWSSVVAPVAAHVPVVTGEVGDNVCSAVSYVPTLLPWADLQGISYLGWTWNTWSDCNNVLISDYAGTPTANYGLAFKGLLATSNP